MTKGLDGKKESPQKVIKKPLKSLDLKGFMVAGVRALHYVRPIFIANPLDKSSQNI
jgi:hypothetical protein